MARRSAKPYVLARVHKRRRAETDAASGTMACESAMIDPDARLNCIDAMKELDARLDRFDQVAAAGLECLQAEVASAGAVLDELLGIEFARASECLKHAEEMLTRACRAAELKGAA